MSRGSSCQIWLVYVLVRLSWKCKKQDQVSKFSIESKYHAISSVSFEIICLKGLLHELSTTISTPLYAEWNFNCDQSRLSWATGSISRSKTFLLEKAPRVTPVNSSCITITLASGYIYKSYDLWPASFSGIQIDASWTASCWRREWRNIISSVQYFEYTLGAP